MTNAATIELLARGFQGFPDCTECQCYPEGRNDCPKHRECRRVLGYQTNIEKAQDYAAAVRRRNPSMQVSRHPHTTERIFK